MPYKNVKSKQGARRDVGSGMTPRARARTSERLSTIPSPQRQPQQPRSTFTATNVKAVGPPSDSNESDSDDNELGNGNGSRSPQRATRTARAKTDTSVTGLQFPETGLGAKTVRNRPLHAERSNEGRVTGVSSSDEGKRAVAGSSGGETGLCAADAKNPGADGSLSDPELKSGDHHAPQLGVATTTRANATSSNTAIHTAADTNTTTATTPASPTTRLAALPATPTRATRQRTGLARALGNKRDREESDKEEGSPFKEMKRLRMSTPAVDDGAREDESHRPLESRSTSVATAKEDAPSSNADEQSTPIAEGPSSDLREGQPEVATNVVGPLATPSLIPIQAVSDSDIDAYLDSIPTSDDPQAAITLITQCVFDALLKIRQGIPLTQEELDFLRLHANYLRIVTFDFSGTVYKVGEVVPSPPSSAPQAQSTNTQIATGPTTGVVHSSAGNFGDYAQAGFMATTNIAPLTPGQGLPQNYDSAPNSENVKVWKRVAKMPAFSVVGPGFGA